MKEIQQLIEISQFYGKNPDFVIAGGGNTSYKNDQYIWVKASGISLANITESGFAVLDREKLKKIVINRYSEDSAEREAQIKKDLFRANIYPENNLRPSVETSMHEIINYKFVVHTHPTVVNALMCTIKSEKLTYEIFGKEIVFVPYTDPGYVLFRRVEKELVKFRAKYLRDPKLIFLQNHGIFVSANKIEEINDLYADVISKIEERLTTKPTIDPLPVSENITQIVPAIRALLTDVAPKSAVLRHNTLIKHFYNDSIGFGKINMPFTPDIIVYCKARPIFVESTSEPEQAIEEFKIKLETYKNDFGYTPKIVVLKDIGYLAVEDNYKSAEIALDVFEDLLKISFLSENFNGPKFMNDNEISFIDNWEVENYRRSISKGLDSSAGKAANKIAIITGGAQGFGAGIVEDLFAENANVVIADLNEKKGNAFAAELNSKAKKNRALFVKTDVSDPISVKNLIFRTVKAFGGLDLLISNAGILHAGSLEEMTPETFDLMTKVNYSAYFLCVKYSSQIMKLQALYKKEYFTDIIQINSKSGLKGSNKNFAYAGGKFGGIGLTQSFALELMPFKVKVNSVCPGNYFDGPLWSDPEKGLFVQYLKTGKVPGAQTIEDVKAHYEKQVPAGRGCEPKDVMQAIYYIMEQKYETGQAVPVTGGQEMLS